MEYSDAKRTVRDEASIEYVMSYRGFLTPASVVHRHSVDGQLLTENLYRYGPFRLFTTDTDIQFTGLPDPETIPAAPGAKKK